MTRTDIETVYHRLLAQHGPQQWWPAETAFEVMVGAILTQNTSWANVERAIGNLRRANLLSAVAIVECDRRMLAEMLRPSGYFNIKTERLRHFCSWYVAKGGYDNLKYWSTPRLRCQLLSVNGIGLETADDMLLYGFGRAVFVVDAYTRRLLTRLGQIEGDEPYEELRIGFETLRKDARLYGEYHALIVKHAKDVCRSRPVCGICGLKNLCPTFRPCE